MADLTYGSLSTLCSWPWLVKKFDDVEASTTAGTLPHGEGRAPDMYWVINTLANPSANTVSITSVDATNLNVDCEDNSGDEFEVFCIWLSQASGGLTNVT